MRPPPQTRHLPLVAGAFSACAAAVFLAGLAQDPPDPEPQPERGDRVPSPATARTSPKRAVEAGADALGIAPSPKETRPAANLSGIDLGTVERTIESQLRLLAERRDVALRATFLPDLRDDLTPGAVDLCRQRVLRTPVQPEWATAAERREGSVRVRSVTLLGSSTDFYELDGNWLAGRLWCLPEGLP
jgi:hypothetical protein